MVCDRPGSVSRMSEHAQETGAPTDAPTEAPTDAEPWADATEPAPVESFESTGDDAVDAVIASLGGLDALPVDEHVTVFENAHESLRRTLAGAGQDSPGVVRS